MRITLKGASFFLAFYLSFLTHFTYGEAAESSKGSQVSQKTIPQAARIHFGPGPRFMKVEHSYSRTHGSSNNKSDLKKTTHLNNLVRASNRHARIHFGPGPSAALGASHPTVNSVRRTTYKGTSLSKAVLASGHRTMKGKK